MNSELPDHCDTEDRRLLRAGVRLQNRVLELTREVERLREALRTIEQRGTYGYQDLNSGGVLASVRRIAHDALAVDEESR